VRYVRPLRLDEEVDALVRIDRVGTASMVYRIELHGAGADDLRAAIELIYVHVDLATGKSTPIPEAFRARVTALP
jgi:acyl-CoA thioester hydrolase